MIVVIHVVPIIYHQTDLHQDLDEQAGNDEWKTNKEKWAMVDRVQQILHLIYISDK